MFSDNRRISERQMKRLLLYDMLGISTLLLPSYLAGLLGRDGIFAIMLAVIPALLVVRLMQSVLCTRDDRGHTITANYPAMLKERTRGGFLFFRIFYGLEGICIAGFALYYLTDLMLKELLSQESFWLISIILLLLGAYGIYQGIEGRARVYELLYWMLMIPLLLLLLFAAKDVNVDYWAPVAQCRITDLLIGTGVVFLYYMILTLALFLTPYLNKQANVGRSCRRSLIQVAGLNAAVYLITLGVFGANSLAGLDYPIITLLSMVKLPGGFLERQDAFMVAIWFFTLYALLNTGMFYAADMIKGINVRAGEQKKGQGTGGRWRILAVMVLVYAETCLFYRIHSFRGWFLLFQICGAVPLTLVLLIVMWVCQKGEKHR